MGLGIRDGGKGGVFLCTWGGEGETLEGERRRYGDSELAEFDDCGGECGAES